MWAAFAFSVDSLYNQNDKIGNSKITIKLGGVEMFLHLTKKITAARAAILAFNACVFVWLFLISPATADEAKGTIGSVKQVIWAEREGKRVDLSEGAEIFEFDILKTDATGSGIVKFIDESTLDIGSDSEIDVREVAFTGDRNQFDVGITRGAARVITGAIVRKNPRGFRLSTPRSTIGIRGTDLSVILLPDGQENVDVNALGEGHSVYILDRKSGTATTISRSGMTYSRSVTGSITINGLTMDELDDMKRDEPNITIGVSIVDPQGAPHGDGLDTEDGSSGGEFGGGGNGGGNGGGMRRGGGDQDGDCCGDNNSAPGR
jgi:uncharacterized membrane protein YgcG